MPSFLDINREERFFCAVLLHVLLTPGPSQHRVLDLLNATAGSNDLYPEDLEAYVEVAALRDAWYALGDHNKYTPAVHAARLEVLHDLLRAACGVTADANELDALIHGHCFFWSTPARKKLHSPGRWPLKQLQAATAFNDHTRLMGLKWAFNAKPDLLLLSGQQGVLVEAKAASTFSKNHAVGYDQESVQDLIAVLFPVVTRGLVEAPLRRITLTNVAHGDTGVMWSDIVSAVRPADIGAFSYAALERATAVLS